MALAGVATLGLISAGAERVPEGGTLTVHTSSRTANGRIKPIHVRSPRGEQP
jgi:hypothetical protein